MIRQHILKLNFLFILFFSIFLIIFQSTVLSMFFKSLRPDLILILIIYLSFHRYLLEGIFLSLIIGWFVEALSGVPHGLIMTTYLWIFLVSKMVGLAVFLMRIWGTLLVVTLMGLFQIVLVFGLTTIFLQTNPSFDLLIKDWFAALFLQLITTPFIFLCLTEIDRIFVKESPSKITGVLGAPIITH